MKLYRSMAHSNRWIAYVPGSGWMMFPARENGWEQRQPARGIDPLHLREVPSQLAVNTGILEPTPAVEFADVA